MGCSHSQVRVQPEASLSSSLQLLDEQVIEALEHGTIRLLSVSYLLGRPKGFRLSRLQELEIVKGALLTPAAAAAAMRSGARHVLALTYGWLSPGNPDPTGKRFEAVQRALRWLHTNGLLPKTAGLFWDFGSLPQKPRTPTEDATFKAGLAVMANLYASALVRRRPPHTSNEKKNSSDSTAHTEKRMAEKRPPIPAPPRISKARGCRHARRARVCFS